jgi:S-layer family protein
MKPRALMIGFAFVLGESILEAQPVPPTSVLKTYGTNFQTLHVGAAAFHPSADAHDYGFEPIYSGYLMNGATGATYVAPLTLPAGAQIHALCAYLSDSSEENVNVFLSKARLIPGGFDPGTDAVGFLSSSWDTGFGVVCADVVPPYTYTEVGDQDGVFLAHYLWAYLPQAAGIGGVKVIYRLQVSPPPVVATFADVPAGHLFHPFVEALAASGITAGCGSGNYCPDQPLTRGQMAAFLSKALGLHWPY